MAETKLGSASRYGARYSSPLKKEVKEIEEIQRKKQVCPKCGRKSLKRKGYAIWGCSKCGAEVAGGAYKPKTDSGVEAKRIVEKEGIGKEKVEELKEETGESEENEEEPEE